MKKIALLLLTVTFFANAKDVYVQPHITKNGTYVQGHYRTGADNNPYNNYSTQGNMNPYTGQSGTVNPYAMPQPVQPTLQPTCLRDIHGRCM
jgi:hypothetical protein